MAATQGEGWCLGAREKELDVEHTAILVIDMQNYCCHPEGSSFRKGEQGSVSEYFVNELPKVVARIQALIYAGREAKVEIIYTTIESLTHDGRDRSLDYKISGFNIAKNSWDAKVIDQLAPGSDDIVLPKNSSSVFISTNINYVLQNLDIRQLVIVGGLTDQCIDSAVRDACDMNYLVTVVTDACITHSLQRHESSLNNNKGYARQRKTSQMIEELGCKFDRIKYSTDVANLERLWKSTELNETSSTTTVNVVSLRKPQMREYIRFEVIDFNGKSLSKVIPARHQYDDVEMYSGAIALGANAEVMVIPESIMQRGCPNAKLLPDWTTLQKLPWASFKKGQRTSSESGVVVHRVYCGQENIPTPRDACVKLLKQLVDEFNLNIYSASELEFCIANADDWSKPAFKGTEIFTTLQHTKVADFTYMIEEAMEEVGIDIRTINTEYGEGQLEITFGPKFGIAAPDAAHTFRTAVKEIAQSNGYLATFQSKPFNLNGPGNGGHYNFSLWEKKIEKSLEEGHKSPNSLDGLIPIHYSEADNKDLSDRAKHFLAGILLHAKSLEAFCSPTVPCYQRHGSWAPVVANYGSGDRSAAVRLKDGYFELRMPSSSACAYLILAGIVAAGLDGLHKQLPLPVPGKSCEDGAALLPTTLEASLTELEKDEWIRSHVGEELVLWYVQTKRAELAAVEKAIKSRKPKQSEGLQTTESDNDIKMDVWRHYYMEYI